LEHLGKYTKLLQHKFGVRIMRTLSRQQFLERHDLLRFLWQNRVEIVALLFMAVVAQDVDSVADYCEQRSEMQ
jgi:hypothetical protein